MLKIAMLVVSGLMGLQVAAAQPIPYKVKEAMPDAVQLVGPADVKLTGYLGERIARNEMNRLLHVDEEVLLGGFRNRPGSHPWIGEHVGKWLHASVLAWVNSGNPQLKAKIDRVVAELIKCQEPDGYLGTYLAKDRWTSWDVWSHKYNLIGLLTYYQYTGNEAALGACRKMADLLIATFPGQKSLIKAGEHVGMAATSVLEPMVVLYRFTGEQKYLDFAKYIVSSYDEPNGPGVVKTLTEIKRVDKTANGKAYEMLSNLVGLCELARVTGDRKYLVPAMNAWEDIVANHRYITGSMSQHEHFHAPHDLPNGDRSNICETCVTVTWIQLNMQLMRMTGEAKYGDELERTFYNHLAAAQRPDGAQWCYYTSLQGKKPYGPGTNCCVSSGPRGMAMIPQLSYFKYQADGKDGLAATVFEPGRLTAQLDGKAVTMEVGLNAEMAEGATPVTMNYAFEMDQPATFAFKVRSPAWAEKLKVKIPGEAGEIAGRRGGWAVVPARRWKSGDEVTVSFEVPARVVVGEYSNKGFNAATWGPMVLAYDEKVNAGFRSATGVMLLEGADQAIKLIGSEPLVFEARARMLKDGQTNTVVLVPFAEAGAEGGRYQIWLRDVNNRAPISLLMDGKESRSRRGNVNGSINDGDPESYAVTYDGQAAAEDWYAVSLDAPAAIKRVVYAHGHLFHDGGWFDASAGKPRVQVQREKNGAWEAVGVLESYPATSASDSRGLKDGQEFVLTLKEPAQVVAVRVIGKPASGDRPEQAFSSCAELAAFGD